ncbi:MAG: DoxX family protein [Candidatus Colwellbacteria bacterium]
MDTLFFIDKQLVISLLRIVLGVVMIYYGQAKLKDLKANTRDFANMGFKPAWLWGTLTAFVEFVGGISVLLGILAPIWAFAFGVQMIVGTFWKVKAGKSFRDYSYDLQLLTMCLVIITFGSGAFALGASIFN